jgi:hypothetical protein
MAGRSIFASKIAASTMARRTASGAPAKAPAFFARAAESSAAICAA